VEVASPSNSAEELAEKRRICMRNGCREFWAVYPRIEVIDVTTAAGTSSYGAGDTIPLSVFPGRSIAVDAVFGDRAC